MLVACRCGVQANWEIGLLWGENLPDPIFLFSGYYFRKKGKTKGMPDEELCFTEITSGRLSLGFFFVGTVVGAAAEENRRNV